MFTLAACLSSAAILLFILSRITSFLSIMIGVLMNLRRGLSGSNLDEVAVYPNYFFTVSPAKLQLSYFRVIILALYFSILQNNYLLI